MCKSKAVFVSERGKESGTGDQEERRRRTQARGEGGRKKRKKKSGKAGEFTRGLERKKVRRREERKGKRETERKSKRGGWESVTVKRVRACDLSMMMLLLLVCV